MDKIENKNEKLLTNNSKDNWIRSERIFWESHDRTYMLQNHFPINKQSFFFTLSLSLSLSLASSLPLTVRLRKCLVRFCFVGVVTIPFIHFDIIVIMFMSSCWRTKNKPSHIHLTPCRSVWTRKRFSNIHYTYKLCDTFDRNRADETKSQADLRIVNENSIAKFLCKFARHLPASWNGKRYRLNNCIFGIERAPLNLATHIYTRCTSLRNAYKFSLEMYIVQ